MNPYDILGVKEGATETECTSAFRKKVSELHPDRYRDDPDKLKENEEQLKKVNEAYQLLKKSNFKYRQGFEQGNGSSDFFMNHEDLFDMFSNFGFNSGSSFHFRRGQSGNSWKDFFRGSRQQMFRTQISLPLLRTLNKVSVSINIEGQDFKLDLPAGVRNNQTLNFGLMNNRYILEVIAEILPVPNFARVGSDLYYLHFFQKGEDRGSVSLDDTVVDFSFSNESRSGDKVTIKSKGFPSSGSRRGDLVVFLVNYQDDNLKEVFRGWLEWLSLKNGL